MVVPILSLVLVMVPMVMLRATTNHRIQMILGAVTLNAVDQDRCTNGKRRGSKILLELTFFIIWEKFCVFSHFNIGGGGNAFHIFPAIDFFLLVVIIGASSGVPLLAFIPYCLLLFVFDKLID